MPRWSRTSPALAALCLAAAPAAARAQGADSLVLRLGAMSAVTGLEDALADTLRILLPGSAVDRAGNVVLVRGGGAPVRVAACPMDEVGYVVGAIRPDGYLTLRRVGATPVGPLYDQWLEGHRVTVFGRRGPVPGVVGVRSTHLARGRAAGADDPFALDQAFVDVGAASAAQAEALGVRLLAPVTRAKRVHAYGPRGSLVAAPWIGQRAACAALLAAARRAAPPGTGTVAVAFTRRRHFGHDGTAFALARFAGAEALVLGGIAAAPPGSGVVAARDTVAAVPVNAWSLPARYGRTPAETVSLEDVGALERQLVAWLEGR